MTLEEGEYGCSTNHYVENKYFFMFIKVYKTVVYFQVKKSWFFLFNWMSFPTDMTNIW